jgi:(2Fe-2S) ferredoxin
VIKDGRKLFVSPNGVYYKEIKEEGTTLYEVVDIK